MKKSTIKLIVGSLISALLMLFVSSYFGDHRYGEAIYQAVFVLGCMQFFYFSAEATRKSSKSTDSKNC
jgi:hypothetical protein